MAMTVAPRASAWPIVMIMLAGTACNTGRDTTPEGKLGRPRSRSVDPPRGGGRKWESARLDRFLERPVTRCGASEKDRVWPHLSGSALPLCRRVRCTFRVRSAA